MSQAYKSPSGLIVATAEIPLTQGYVTRIDDVDRVFTDGRNWHAIVRSYKRAVYACARVNGRHVMLHNLLCPDWDEVDHADGDGLNNCRSNLRDGAEFRNNANVGLRSNNTSGYKGVYRYGDVWIARIGVNWKSINLGTYDSPEEAAYAYDQAAVGFFGEYARTNAMLGLATAKGAGGRQRDDMHCPAGHEYTPENTYVNPAGKRECRECRRDRKRKAREASPGGGKPCPSGCTCGRHNRLGPLQRKQTA